MLCKKTVGIFSLLLRNQASKRFVLWSPALTFPRRAHFSSEQFGFNQRVKPLPEFEPSDTIENKYVHASIDAWIQNCLKDCEKTIENYGSTQNYHNVLRMLWSFYVGVTRMKDTKIFEIYPLLKHIIPDSLFKEEKHVQDLRSVIAFVVQVFEVNIRQALQDPRHFCFAAKVLVKYESTYSFPEFWRLFDRVARRIISPLNSHPANREFVIPLLKILTEKRHFYKKFKKDNQSEELSEILNLENDMLDFLSQNLLEFRNCEAWILLVSKLYYTGNREALDRAMKLFKTVIKNTNDVHSFIYAISSDSKIKDIPEFNYLFENLRSRILAQIDSPDLTLVDISLLFKAFIKDPIFSEHIFNTLWKKTNNQLKKEKERIDLFSVSLILLNFSQTPFFTVERFEEIKPYLMAALEHAQTQAANAKNQEILFDNVEEEENLENEDSENGYTFQQTEFHPISRVIKRGVFHILHTLYNLEDRIAFDPQFIKKIYDLLNQNIHMLFSSNLPAFLNYSAMIMKQLESKNTDPQVCEEIKEKMIWLISFLWVDFQNQIHLLNTTKLVALFSSFVQLDYLDKTNYQSIEAVLFKRNIHAFCCFRILDMIVLLQKKSANLNTHQLEEHVTKCLISSIHLLPTTHLCYFGLRVKDVQQLSSFNSLNEKYQEFLVKNLQYLPQKDLSYLFLVYTNEKICTPEFIKAGTTVFLETVAEADPRTIRFMLEILMNQELGHPEIYRAVENVTLQKVRAVLNLRDERKDTSDFVKIFFETTKYGIENIELIKRFEELFTRDIETYGYKEAIFLLAGLSVYFSPNIELIKKVMERLNSEIATDENKEKFSKSLPQIMNLMHALWTIEVYYQSSIKIADYPNIQRIFMHRLKNTDKMRKPEMNDFQKDVFEAIQNLKIPYTAQGIVGFHFVDFMLQPNIVVEVCGTPSFQNQTKKLTWRTQHKLKEIKKVGHKVIPIPYFEWDKLGDSSHKLAYLRNKIEKAKAEN